MAEDTMEALRADVVRFAQDCTPAEADRMLQDIATIFVLPSQQLPGFVQTIATAANLPRPGAALCLHMLVRIVQTTPGQDLILRMAGVVAAVRATRQAKPTGHGH